MAASVTRYSLAKSSGKSKRGLGFWVYTHPTHINHVGGSQNYSPFLGTLNIRCRTILGTQKGTIILTPTHIPK